MENSLLNLGHTSKSKPLRVTSYMGGPLNLWVDHLICVYHTVLRDAAEDKDNIMGNGASGDKEIFLIYGQDGY